MKYLSLLAAAFAATAFSGAMAQSYQCSGSELSGGANGAACYSNSGSRIIDVERQGNGYVRGPVYAPGASAGYDQTFQQGFGATRVYAGSGPFERPGYVARGPVATSYGFEWTESEPYYGNTRSAVTTAYRREAHGAARPCAYRPGGQTVTRSYTGCPYSGGFQTTYVTPAPVYSAPVYAAPVQPAPAPVYVDPAPVYDPGYGYDDYTPVVARHSGVCRREITELREDSHGRPRYEVCYRDLQPLYGQRIDVLYARIERAASRACDVTSSFARRHTTRTCEAQAVDRAVYDTGLDALQSYHIAKTGHGRPRVTVGPLRRY